MSTSSEEPINTPKSAMSEASLDDFRVTTAAAINPLIPIVFDATKAEEAMNSIAEAIGTDTVKLKTTVDVIYNRAMQSEHWADMAVKLLTMLCERTPEDLSDPDIALDKSGAPFTGPRLVRKYLFTRIQSDFDAEIEKQNWSTPLVHLLYALSRTENARLRIPYRTQADIISNMSKSEHLFVEANLELFLLFVSWLGPDLDRIENLNVTLTEVLKGVKERADLESALVRLAILGLMRLREHGWPSDDL